MIHAKSIACTSRADIDRPLHTGLSKTVIYIRGRQRSSFTSGAGIDRPLHTGLSKIVIYIRGRHRSSFTSGAGLDCAILYGAFFVLPVDDATIVRRAAIFGRRVDYLLSKLLLFFVVARFCPSDPRLLKLLLNSD